MAGKVQHEIPRLYQRGFLIQDTGDAERIYVFRRDRFYPSNIDRSGAESYFYSKPSDDGERTLDDEVTAYESRLGSLVQELRSGPLGQPVDGRTAGEVIAHLTTRNAHLRGAFVHGFRTLAKGAADIFGDEDNVRRLLGIDAPWISDRFRERIITELTTNPQVAALGVDPGLFERFIFASVREGFSPLFQAQMSGWTGIVSLLLDRTAERVRDIHNKALATTVAPEPRIDDLARFAWHKVESDTELILPDCVAIAVEANGDVHPLMMADLDNTNLVLLPLRSHTLLVGARADAPVDLAGFNAAAAGCSHRYFLAGSQTDDFIALSKTVGTRSVLVVETAIKGALDEFSPKPVRLPDEILEAPPQQPRSIPVTFAGDFDQTLVHTITDCLSALLGQLAWTIPLDRLDGITFADDYPAALVALDRGKAGIAQPETRQDDVSTGIGQSPTVIRDGVPKSHVIVVGHVGRALVTEDEKLQIWATAVLAELIAHAGVLQVVDETLPGVLLTRQCEAMEGDLVGCTYRGWNAYFSTRASSGFDERRLFAAQEIMLVALADAFTEIPKARFDYRFHADIKKLFDIVLPKIGFILEHAGNVLGVADGTDQDPLEDAGELRDFLARNELLAWFSDYRRDLIFLWDRRRQWESYDEFLALNRHAERLLWCFSIIPWMTPDGHYRVEIPLQTDQEALSAFLAAQAT